MHARTALVVAGSALAVPSAALAAADDTDAPMPEELRAPLAGHSTVGAHLRVAGREASRRRLVRENLRLTRRHVQLSGEEVPRDHARRIRNVSVRELRRSNERLRSRLGRLHSAASPALEAIAACESGGNPSTNTGNGFYGKYQFTLSTWQAVGGKGNPAAASEPEQDRRAAQLYAQAGPGQWPVCGA